MEYVIVSFRSRAHTVKFHEFLRRNGISSEIVNTPKEAGVGCGLSVRVSKEQLSTVKKLVYLTKLSSFAGVFLYKTTSRQRSVRSI